jgi:hypothetical protein
MKFGTFLLSLVQPVLAKLLLALGFSVVSIVGVEATVSQVKGMFVDSFGMLSADAMNLAQYLWITKGIGIIFGAINTKLALWAIEKSTQILGKNPG